MTTIDEVALTAAVRDIAKAWAESAEEGSAPSAGMDCDMAAKSDEKACEESKDEQNA